MSETGSDVAPPDERADVEPRGRLRSTGEALAGFIRRVPFSIAIAVVLVTTAIVTGTAIGTAPQATAQTWAAGVITTFDEGQWWTAIVIRLTALNYVGYYPTYPE